MSMGEQLYRIASGSVKEKTTKAKFILIYKLFKDLAGGVPFVFLELRVFQVWSRRRD